MAERGILFDGAEIEPPAVVEKPVRAASTGGGSIETLLMRFSDVKGYQAAQVVSLSGENLAQVSVPGAPPLEDAAAILAGLMARARDAMRDTDFGTPRGLVPNTGKASLRVFEPEKASGFLLPAVLEKDENQELARLWAEKPLPALALEPG
jgi:hypothetical protein